MTIEKIAGRINHGPAFFIALQMRSNLPDEIVITSSSKIAEMI
jgi:hypothetical protein